MKEYRDLMLACVEDEPLVMSGRFWTEEHATAAVNALVCHRMKQNGCGCGVVLHAGTDNIVYYVEGCGVDATGTVITANLARRAYGSSEWQLIVQAVHEALD